MLENNIPILYYHSIATHQSKNEWSFLSCDVLTFKLQMWFLNLLGYRSCSWSELHNHLNGVYKLPRKTVMFHFDDGFLDNWTVVYPIMKRYGFIYSVLITPEFIEKSCRVREFVDTTTDENEEDWWGYLSEGEVREMSKSGLVDFQCHGFSHTWYESSDRIVDFKSDNNLVPHLIWNNNTENKPFWLKRGGDRDVPLGYPIFEFQKSLELERRFVPNPRFIEDCIETTKASGFNRDRLENVYKEYCSADNLGRFESEDESKKRLELEIIGTRDYIEKLTGKDSSYIVFPGGGMNDSVMEFIRDNKFKLISKGKQSNGFNSKIVQVRRLAGFVDFKAGRLINSVLNIPLICLQLMRGHGSRILNLLIRR